MAKGKKTGGRQKGTPNVLTGCMKDEVWKVFNALQDDPKLSLQAIAEADPKFFYAVFGSRMIPKIIEGELKGNIGVVLQMDLGDEQA